MTDRRQRRLERERRTIEAMVRLHCEGKHRPEDGICDSCRELLDYALLRIDRCPWGAEKPACANCEIHCYKPEPRERIRDVMRYAGPRMLPRHPVLALLHILDGKRPATKDALLEKRRGMARTG